MTGEKLSGAPPRASGAAAVLTRPFDGQWVAISSQGAPQEISIGRLLLLLSWDRGCRALPQQANHFYCDVDGDGNADGNCANCRHLMSGDQQANQWDRVMHKHAANWVLVRRLLRYDQLGAKPPEWHALCPDLRVPPGDG